MEPVVAKWFGGKFRALTEPQAYAVPLIHKRKNVLVSSPTGSGKTLTAFLSIINELVRYHSEGALEDRIYCVYVSPLKALANDINRNLEEPLAELRATAQKHGFEMPDIRVAVRTGDTTTAERQKMVKKPPHIFITTPESLAIVLSTKKFSERFQQVEWVIIDEIHELCNSKRGAFLSLTIERLAQLHPFVRIGLSATQAPIEDISGFLGGYSDDGSLRPVSIVEVSSQKELRLDVASPVDDLTSLPYDKINAKVFDQLKTLIETHRTTLIFTNTRSGTERVAHRLKELGVESLEPHHGSLSKAQRLSVEERLKKGALKAAVTSTSLELGIDIGYIDLVCQMGSPKTVAKALQRIGRAGHAYGAASHGTFIVTDPDDAAECAVIVRDALDYRIDRVRIPRNCLDVLAQTIVGMTLERRWKVKEALALVRRSYCYHTLTQGDYDSVIDYLASGEKYEGVYSKIWHDKSLGLLGMKKSSRMIYYLNAGTIPEESDYHVFLETTGSHLGKLSEKFAERLSRRDIFLLGGKTYEFVQSRGQKVFVKDARGKKPTVPSWTGELLPMSPDLARSMGGFRKDIGAALAKGGEKGAVRHLMERYCMDRGSAVSVARHFREQMQFTETLPDSENFAIEGYEDRDGNFNQIFHFCLGRRINDALARAYAHALSRRHSCGIRFTVSDDNFMLTSPKKIDISGILGEIKSAELESRLREAVKESELFKQRFRHCASRSFMILRNYKGRDVDVGKQQSRSHRILDNVQGSADFPVIKETFAEIMRGDMDIDGAREALERIESGKVRISTLPYSDIPSPFSHKTVLAGISDIILMDDKSSILRELHKKVLDKVGSDDTMGGALFKPDALKAYFESRFPRITTRTELSSYLRKAGALSMRDGARASVPAIAGGNGSGSGGNWKKWVLQLQKDKKAAVHTVHGFSALVPTGPEPATNGCGHKNGAGKSIVPPADENGGDGGTGCAQPCEPEDLACRLISSSIQMLGPMTAAEVAQETGIPGDGAATCLKLLENDGDLVSGYFGREGDLEYIAARDLIMLQNEGKKVYDWEVLREYAIRKQFGTLHGLQDFFDRHGEVSLPFDIYNHVRKFDYAQFVSLLSSGKLLQGRFVKGRVKYVPKDEAPLYVSIYRANGLDPLDRKILRLLQDAPKGLSLSDIENILPKGEADEERLKASMMRLDSNLYVMRAFYQSDLWAPQNRYVLMPKTDPVPALEARTRLVERFVGAVGPVSAPAIQSYTGIHGEDVPAILGVLEREGRVHRILAAGDGRSKTELFVSPADASAIEKMAASPDLVHDGTVRILSLSDPFIIQYLPRILSQYGEGRYYPVMKGPELVGYVEMWEKSDRVDVRNIHVEGDAGTRLELLGDVLEALDRVLGFYSQQGYEVLMVHGAWGKDAYELEPDVLSLFKERGYALIQSDMLVKGPVAPDAFEWQSMLNYILWTQHIHPERQFESEVQAVKEMHGLRSDNELALRLVTENYRSLRDFWRGGALVHALMIPEYSTFATPEDCLLYKRAKSRTPDDNMKAILSIFSRRQNRPVEKEKLLEDSPLGLGSFQDSLRDLQLSLHVLKSAKGQYYATADLQMAPQAARKAVLVNIIRQFGIISAENLAIYTKFEYKISEVRSTLKALEAEGTLVRGYFVKGDDNLYWMERAGHELLKGGWNKQIQGDFVLTPDDRLSIYLSGRIYEQFRMKNCYTVFKDGAMVGAFKARLGKGELILYELNGGAPAEEIMREFSYRKGLRIVEAEDEPEEEDWELISYVDKTRNAETE